MEGNNQDQTRYTEMPNVLSAPFPVPCERAEGASPDWCVVHQQSLWSCVAELRADRNKWQEAEMALGSAYLDLQRILGAFDTPHAPTRSQIWACTEACARKLVESAAWAKMHHCKPPLGSPTREEAIDALVRAQLDYDELLTVLRELSRHGARGARITYAR